MPGHETTGFSVSALGTQLLEIIVFVPLILVGLSRAGAYVLRKVVRDEAAYFVIMLVIMAIVTTMSTTPLLRLVMPEATLRRASISPQPTS